MPATELMTAPVNRLAAPVVLGAATAGVAVFLVLLPLVDDLHETF